MNDWLRGVTVLDFTRALAGPFCTMNLADLGARVIKVELPERGDDARHIGPFVGGASVYFASVNRGKESLTLDLHHPRAGAVVARLLPRVDVLVENFRPGVMARFGLDAPTLRAAFPRLIYLSLSGFGQHGPNSQRGAYDVIVQAMGGLMSLTGPEGGPPVRVGTSVGDLVPALYATISVLAALQRRHTTGEGAHLDVAMQDAIVAILENALARYSATGQLPVPLGTRHPSITPFAMYPCADGHIVVAAGANRHWIRLCEVLGEPELAFRPPYDHSEGRTQNVHALNAILDPLFEKRTGAEWETALIAAGVPCGRVQTIADLFADPQLQERETLVEIPQPEIGPLWMPRTPIRRAGETPDEPGFYPLLGEHTDSVLTELASLSAEEIAELRAEGAI